MDKTMIRRNVVGITGAATVLVLISSGALTARAQGPTAPPKPKISAKQAEAAAVKKVGGKVLSSKYEFEDGRWQYAVIVKNKMGPMYEVEVSSTTGKVLDMEKTSAEEEAKEEAADKKKAVMGGRSKEAPEKGEKDEKDEKPEKGEKS